VRDDVRDKLRSSIKTLLVKHGYPPDQQPAAIKLVIEQMNPGVHDGRHESPKAAR
jgi:type I restriction enzyme R subunit